MADLSGTTIKNFELRRLLGAGSFGAVYLAFQPVIDREVAIKVILPEHANQTEFIRNFEVEAQLIARLEHPHIVPLYDYWRDPNGAYLVMRWLRGGSLTDRLEKGPLDLATLDHFLEQLAAGLAVAHRKNVVHRDLKPDNLLLDEEGNLYISDFGIARLTGQNEETDSVSGTLAYISPEQLLAEPPMPQMDIYSVGVILYEMLAGAHPYKGYTATDIIQRHLQEELPPLPTLKLELPDELNRVIQKATAKALDERYQTIQELWRDFHRIATSEALMGEIMPATVGKAANPYKGLRAFQEADAGDFFGREILVEDLIERMQEDVRYQRFLAVVGPSGSGKSSVVRAGMIPGLRKGMLPGSQTWFICDMVPGATPIENLAQALLSVSPSAIASLPEKLHKDSNALYWVVSTILGNTDSQLLLVIDQFEELFTLVEQEDDRQRFLELLYSAITEEDSKLRVIVTLRADFYDRPLLYENFGAVMQIRTQVVLPMTVAELQRAITEPAQQAGILVDQELVNAIIADVREEPGMLPLLQYALTEMYERSEGSTMSLDAYEATGGVAGALAKRAEEAFNALKGEEQGIARQLFLRLVTFGEGAEDTRRRVPQAELLSLASYARSAVQSVIALLGHNRLITLDNDPISREPTVELAHEAIIREWERLRTWLDESRSDLRFQRQLAVAAAEWQNAHKEPSYLLRGSRLTQFQEWSRETSLGLTDAERGYLEHSVAKQEEEDRAREAARLDKERLEARERQRQRQFIAVLLVGVVTASLLSVFAFRQGAVARSEAEANATAQNVAQLERDGAQNARATSEANAANLLVALNQIRGLRLADVAAQTAGRGDIDLGLSLAVEADRINPTSEQVQRTLLDIASQGRTWKRLVGHTDDVRLVAFTPDGQRVITGTQTGELFLWDVESGQLLQKYPIPEKALLVPTVSPDTTWVASGTDVGGVILWELQTKKIIQRFEGQTSAVEALGFSHDAAYLAAGVQDGTVIVWETATGKIVNRFRGHTGAVFSVAFNANSSQLVTGSADNTVIIWDVPTAKVLHTLNGHTRNVYSTMFSPDNKYLLTASGDGTLVLWDTTTGELKRRMEGHKTTVNQAIFTPDGKTIISGSSDDTIIAWDTDSGAIRQRFAGHAARVLGVAVSPDGKLIASGSSDDTVRLWLASRLPIDTSQEFAGHKDEVKQAVFSPDGRLILSAAGTPFGDVPLDTRLILWDRSTGRILRYFNGHKDSVTCVAFSPDGKTAVSGSRDNHLILWDVSTGQPLRWFEGHQDWVWSVAFSPDGQTILSASKDKTLILWDVNTGDIIRTLMGHDEWVNSGVFSVDGRQILSGSDDGTLILWDTATGKMLRRFTGHEGTVQSAALSPDGTRAISVSSDSTAIVWNVATGSPVQRFEQHENPINSVAFSPTQTYAATAGYDNNIYIWDIATGQVQTTLPVAHETVYSLSYSSDGKWLLAAYNSGIVRLWPLAEETRIQWVKDNLYLPALTCEQRAQWDIEPLCESKTS